MRIAISMGDPAGIGPEVVVKSIAALHASSPDVRWQIHGNRDVFARLAGASTIPPTAEWVEIPHPRSAEVRWGAPDAVAGKLQVDSLASALDTVLEGRADALCTAPITKAAARLAGFPFPGHTEYLADRCGVRRFVMMLAGPRLRVVPLTGHIALRSVAASISTDSVATALAVTVLGLRDDFGLSRPSVALAALNPHAGEAGMMGDEESRILEPALRRAADELAAAGVDAELRGPLPADGLFAHFAPAAEPPRLDAVVCCYHDQALIPLKLLHRDEGVNVTLGLPIVRTSPAHGSALDIAGRGVARPESMIAALRLAIELALRRRDRRHPRA